MNTQPYALQRCFDEVAQSAPMALERCLKHVVSVLQEAERASLRTAERNELGEAWRELLEHQATWCRRYPDELRIAFESAVKPKAEPAAALASGGARASKMSELTLVDDADIVEAIESSRLVQGVMPLVERPVSELDALVSSAMGLNTVRPELNPVRPEVFAQSLRALVGRTQVKAATGSLWMKYMAEPLGHELQDLYGRLVTQLKDANVQAAGYRVNQSVSAVAAGTGASTVDAQAKSQRPSQDKPAVANAGAAPGAGGAPIGQSVGAYGNLSSQQITHALLRDFLVNGGGAGAAESLPASYYAEVDRELAAIKGQSAGPPRSPQPLPQGYREMPVVDRPQRWVGVESALSAEVWGGYAQSHERSLVRTRLRKDATRVAQVLGLELVRKVVNQVAQDPRLLTPVREAIVALEPSLLRLAMVDPRFFSEEHHPGRRLMENVAQRSFRYNDEFSAEFAGFFRDVSRSFNGLNQSRIESARPFEDALVRLEAAWSNEDRMQQELHDQAVDAVRFAELRQAEADRIAWDLSTRPDLEAVPSVVQDFLFGPWSLVIAHARLTDRANQIDPHGYRAVISDLLWSVKPEVTLRQPAQLFERVPRLVGLLRAGLASLGQGPEENEAFFQALMQLHRPVLKLRRAKTRRDARESGHAPLTVMDKAEVVDDEAPRKTLPSHAWMSAKELDAAGFEETLPSDMGELMPESGPSGAAPLAEAPETSSAAPLAATAERMKPAAPAEARTPRRVAETSTELVLENLREGDWVDLYSKRKWLRAKLIWASTKGTLFMFVSHGGQPHSMTKRVCERLIRDRYLRPVRMHGVVAHALGALDHEPPT